MNTPQTRTLERALAMLGDSKPALSAALGITCEDLRSYLDGTQPLPDMVFLDAIDIVAGLSTKVRRNG